MENKAEYNVGIDLAKGKGKSVSMTPSGKSKGSGRPVNPRGKILSNGLFESQAKRLHEEAKLVNIPMANFQRRVIDQYFYQLDRMRADLSERKETDENDAVAGEYCQSNMFDEFPLIFINHKPGEQSKSESPVG